MIAGTRTGFFSNLHKWGFAPHTSCAVYAKSEALMRGTKHVIPSWNSGKGLISEASWSGTRDYSSFFVVPDAVDFLKSWRGICESSGEVIGAEKYCSENLLQARNVLQTWWRTGNDYSASDDICSNMCMVKLPFDTPADAPHGSSKRNSGSGSGSDSDRRRSATTPLRQILREKYNVEAAISHFEGYGSFVRLSIGVYNTMEDVLKLANAVMSEKDAMKRMK